ncbi:Cytochrome P450 [Apiospora phragmitis]|uniref:Cytochrome P450 n=1 Tax=Apiospora phragmitis TaxID=2905665 RepID=A0ABR1W161_9PEZI
MGAGNAPAQGVSSRAAHYPGIGNLHQMPIEKPYLKFYQGAQQYGDIVGLKTGTGNLVLLNTPALVHELFDKRGAICSDRPVNHILTKHVFSGPEEKSIAILQYDGYYRRWRKHWTLPVPLVATTGERLSDMPADYADKLCHSQDELLDLIMPGAASPARYARKLLCDDAENYLVGAKKTYAQIEKDPESVGLDSLLPKIMKEQAAGRDKNKFTETELAYVGQAAVGAAVDTTLATFKNLMVAFAAFPEKLAKAQEKMDRVLRWRPTTPQALPHVLTRDEHPRPYLFPEGTMFIANVWTIHQNEEEYERPHDFIPERFLDNPFGLRPSVAAADEKLENSRCRALYAFGSGRRQCPGEQFAFTSVLLTASKLVWAYDIRPPPGGGIFDVSVETSFKDGTVTQPIRLEVAFRARSEEKRLGVVADAQRTEHIARDLLGLGF